MSSSILASSSQHSLSVHMKNLPVDLDHSSGCIVPLYYIYIIFSTLYMCNLKTSCIPMWLIVSYLFFCIIREHVVYMLDSFLLIIVMACRYTLLLRMSVPIFIMHFTYYWYTQNYQCLTFSTYKTIMSN